MDSVPSQDNLVATLSSALKQELEQLKTARRELTLFDGEYTLTLAGRFYYRFEIPEEVLPRSIEQVSVTVGTRQPVVLTGYVVCVENQFLTLALPKDFGRLLPESHASWDATAQLAPVVERLETPSQSDCLHVLFHPADAANQYPASFEPQPLAKTSPEQLEALKKILQNRVTLLWGPVLTGKTRLLALAASNFLKAGKSVLFVAHGNAHLDRVVERLEEVGPELGLDVKELVTRLGLPAGPGPAEAFTWTKQIDAAKDEKRKLFQERISLLDTFWKIRVKQALNEQYYARSQAIRDRLAELRKQGDQLARDMTRLQETTVRLQNASVLERMKRGFSNEEMAETQRQQTEKQAAYKRLQTLQQALTGDLARLDAESPIGAEETKAYNLAMKRIADLGGVEQVTKSVEEFISVDEAGIFLTKRLVAASVVAAFNDTLVRGRSFDVVLVDEAETLNLPTLAALATKAKERLLVAGDPYQLQPDAASHTELAHRWLVRDLFLHLAQTDQLNRLFDWSQQNPQWCIPLSAQSATTPKLSMFAASVLFDEKVNVFASPQAEGKILFIDSSDLTVRCRQYLGRKRILPCNEVHSKKVVECVKHALVERGRSASHIGVIVPFGGATLYTKLQLRLNGIQGVEVGTPVGFRERRKKTIIFDTSAAGVDYTMRAIDDRKVGEHSIVRLFATVCSSTEDDLYVVADMSHFKTVYKDRLITRFLMLLQAEADHKQPSLGAAVKKFDDLDANERLKLFTLPRGEAPAATEAPKGKVDHELELKMKMLSKQQASKPQTGEKNYDREIMQSVVRVLAQRRDVNLLSQYVGGDLLFRSTLDSDRAIRHLTYATCENEKNFRDIMERWNYLIYELSGGSKTDLTYFAAKVPENRIRDDIRNLKAFYTSDVEAVIEQGKKRIAVEVARVFQELLGKAQQPGNPVEWSTAYLNFLSKLEVYVGWISEQVRR